MKILSVNENKEGLNFFLNEEVNFDDYTDKSNTWFISWEILYNKLFKSKQKSVDTEYIYDLINRLQDKRDYIESTNQSFHLRHQDELLEEIIEDLKEIIKEAE